VRDLLFVEDLVRAFSTAVHRAVRITGPTTIEMVDPSVPLPPGWKRMVWLG